MPDNPADPRRRAFGAVTASPPQTAPEPPVRRGIATPPPPKPLMRDKTVAEPVMPAPDTDRERQGVPVVSNTPASPSLPVLSPAQAVPGGAPKAFGVQRHRMRYVQFQVSPFTSEQLTARADAEDVVLGEVVMDALRAFDASPVVAPLARRRQRRRPGTSVRRSILVRPEEADQVKTMADQYADTPSAFIRRCLELYLIPGE